MYKKFSNADLAIEVEIGKLARQADGSVWIKSGNTIVLATAVESKKQEEFLGFFPLTVEYRERTSAAGKIPGGYMKREGKLSDFEVLVSRLIDRPIRPLFPATYFKEVQILTTVYSSDGKYPSSILALLGASLALTISPMPFFGPIGAIQVGRVNGDWKFNPTYEELEESDADIIIAGTAAGICMVEGHCNDVKEAVLVDIFFKAHEEIKKQITWQLDIQKELNCVEKSFVDQVDYTYWKKEVHNVLPNDFIEQIFAATKVERSDSIESIKNSVIAAFAARIEAKEISEKILNFIIDSIIKELLPDYIINNNARVDGRGFDQVRDIVTEVGLLPCVHGSAVFQRGQTQAIASLTLGTAQDAQKVDTLTGGMQERSFMLHYNFPPFATGEVKPLRGTGRREIGHGFLAETSFINVLPSQETFPYVIRSVVDILESNGSSSMATVCATTMAFLDAGVPIKKMVSGIAMGLMRDKQSNIRILTDILGMEDAFGLMDFKVTGSEDGIFAFQLDIKDKVGLSRDLFEQALEKARIARLSILDTMKKVMSAPREKLSDLAPRVFSCKISPDKIGAVIGPSGKHIKEITAKTGTQIDITDDGVVRIYAKNNESASEAEQWIKTLTGDINIGTLYNGTIKRIADFGLIVELVAGKEGMVHISTIARAKQQTLEKNYKSGDRLRVRVLAVERETGRIRLMSPDLE